MPLSGVEDQWYRSQANRAKQAAALGRTQNAYERKLSNVQAGWGREDMVRQYARQREQFTNPYNRRGMVNSGMYGRDLGRFVDDRRQGLLRQQIGTQLRSQGFNIADDQLARVRDQALQELQAQKRAYQNMIASGIAPYT